MGILKNIKRELDQSALQLMIECRERLYAVAVRECGNATDADDLVSRTLAKAIQKLNGETEVENLFGWLKTMMLNLRTDDLRKTVVRGTKPVDPEDMEACAEADWSTDEQILKNSDSEAIRQALDDLDPKYRQAMLMRYYDDFSLKEIADILRLPMGTVSRRIQIAHRLLAGKLSGKLGKAKKPLTVAVALLLLGGSLFGAWKAGLGEWLSDFVNSQETQQEQTERNEEMNAKTIGKVASVAISSMALASAPVRSAAAAEAGGRIVYATPSGAGTKDGTSWANARKVNSTASFVTAYTNAADGATAEKPNELWLRYGGYMFSQNDIVIQPNVIVRGGFTGTETSADEADPVANPTLFYNNYFDVNATWLDEAQSTMWVKRDGRLFYFDPPVEGDTKMYTKPNQMGNSKVFYRDDGADLGVAAFHGLSFTKFWGSTFRVTGGNGGQLVFRKCRFLHINWLTNSGAFVVQLTGVGADMEDCEFSSCMSPILVKTAAEDSPRLTASFNRCRFFSATGCYNSYNSLGCTSGGIGAVNNVAVTIRNCSFDRNLCGNQNNGENQGGTLSIKTYGDALIEDTVIQRGYGTSINSGGAVCWAPLGDASLTVRRCRFERCCYAGGGDSGINQGAVLTVRGDLSGGRVIRGEVEDTAFIGNYTMETSASGKGSSCVCFGSSCWNQNGRCYFTFLNCLFEKNRAVHPLNGAAGTTIGNSWTQSPRVVFANCVIKDDVCGKLDADGNMVYGTEFGLDGNTYFSFVNTVFENSDENVLPWANGKSVFSFAGCVTDNSGSEYGTGSTSCYRYAPMDAGVSAGLETAPLTNGVVVARRLARTSPYRRKGRPLWRGTDKEIYLYDVEGDVEKPWRQCCYGGVRKTDAEAVSLGVSLAAKPLPDAFDAARLPKSALGQLNAIPNGLIIFLQ